MRTWTRARRARICGRCGEIIPKAAPLLEVYIEAGGYSLKLPKLRCATCAGIPVPDDLPPLVERSNVITPMVPIPVGVGVLPLDFKARQIAREPGDDDAA
jgi:hypothetical protein